MQYLEEKALEIINKHNLRPEIKRVWKNRGSIPDRYFEVEKRIRLPDVLTGERIEKVIEKYPGIESLLESRLYRPGQEDAYYSMSLVSLAREWVGKKK